MVCSACGTENDAGRRFCDTCGAALAAACRMCGASNRPTARFCGDCGTPLDTAGDGASAAPSIRPVQIQPTVAQAERRHVSVLFVDLVGYTTLADGWDPEQARDLLTRYFEIARDIVARYGGTIEKFIGDAVMAVWGAPTAHEDDAERAVRAALELVDRVPGLEPSLRARAGVLTGEAAVTLGATDQGMVAGDLVNTASRLQSVAPPGAVLVDEATERTASKAIAFEPAGEQLLKGKASPVPAYRAMRVVAERGGRKRSETLEAPFTGRDTELRLLKDLHLATARERRIHLVSLTGQAGVGKSRLAWEFEKYLDGLVDEVYWNVGRSPAYGDGVTFWALGEMVRGRAGLLATDDEQTTRQKIAESVATLVSDDGERRWVEAALLALLAVDPAPPGGRESLFAAWRTYFERLATTETAVLLFEDLHWADPGLLDFIDHMLEWSTAAPILIVTLARPELLDRRPAWGAGRRNFVALHLDPLSDASVGEMLDGLVAGLPDSAAEAIIRRADGIPLYAVETVRMLVADDRLAERDGRYVPVGDLAQLAVPESLHALISARLDALDPNDRALLQDAAVLGQSFTPSGLAAVAATDPAELDSHLRGLVRREILVLQGDPRSPERGQYSFVQALVREVAYSTLAKRDRRDRHLAAARFFEALGDDELVGALAAHYLAAFESSSAGPEADAVGAQARIALRAAAERAAALGSHEQAVTFLDQALLVTADPGEQADLLIRTGEAAWAAGRHTRAQELLRDAIARKREAGDRTGEAAATAALGRAMLESFRSEQALAVLAPGAVEFQDLAESPPGIALRAQLARAYFFHGDSVEAIEVADQVLPSSEREDLVALTADTLITKGTALAEIGRVLEGRGAIQAGIDIAERQGWPAISLRGRVNLTYLLALRDPRQAMATAKAGFDDAQRLGIRPLQATLHQNAADSAVRVGEWDWAVGVVEGILATELELEDRSALTSVLLTIRALRGEATEAEISAHEGALEGNADRQIGVGKLTPRLQADFAAGRWDDIEQRCLELLSLDRLGGTAHLFLAGRVSVLRCDGPALRRVLDQHDGLRVHGQAISVERAAMRAGLAALSGQTADARAGYQDVLERWRELGLDWDEAMTGLEMATVLDRAEPDVAAAIGRSIQIFERLRARPFLERLTTQDGPGPAPAAEPVGPIALSATGAAAADRRVAGTPPSRIV
ncbi:MAG TPA: adenylate/guanylate cyclase domain-containing protein [Candidatus Limnocylindrales bacterium]|nr:adenylate/guanylate cyclase domain-containing protein [Candidatus Limnocylindrales bacterium]